MKGLGSGIKTEVFILSGGYSLEELLVFWTDRQMDRQHDQHCRLTTCLKLRRVQVHVAESRSLLIALRGRGRFPAM